MTFPPVELRALTPNDDKQPLLFIKLTHEATSCDCGYVYVTVMCCELVNPELVNPELVNPELVNPELVNPELVNPELVNPELVNPELVNPELVDPERRQTLAFPFQKEDNNKVGGRFFVAMVTW